MSPACPAWFSRHAGFRVFCVISCPLVSQDRGGLLSNKEACPVCLLYTICWFPHQNKYNKWSTEVNHNHPSLQTLALLNQTRHFAPSALPRLWGHSQWCHARMRLCGPQNPLGLLVACPCHKQSSSGRQSDIRAATRINHLQEHSWWCLWWRVCMSLPLNVLYMEPSGPDAIAGIRMTGVFFFFFFLAAHVHLSVYYHNLCMFVWTKRTSARVSSDLNVL